MPVPENASSPLSARMQACLRVMEPFLRFFDNSAWARRAGEPGICDFAVGNPHDMPLSGFVEALQKSAVPLDKNWFGYKMNEPESRQVVTESLHKRLRIRFDPEDIFLTNGAFGALTVSLNTLADRGDEVIFITPPWFFYEAMIAASGATPVPVRIDDRSFDLDLEAIRGAITERTRAIIINSPHNPTGKIYGPGTLSELGSILSSASQRTGRPIYLLSDESYSRIIYDGRDYPSPTQYYPHALLIYTYGKTLLTPGQRIGYVALSPSLPGRESLRRAITAAQFMAGFAFPNALLQHALPELEKLSVDVGHLQRKRDRMVEALDRIGYQVTVPEGTFYLMVRSPEKDDWSFSERLGNHDVLVLPGSLVEMPGYFRVSLTANDDMIERGIPGFAAAWREVSASRAA